MGSFLSLGFFIFAGEAGRSSIITEFTGPLAVEFIQKQTFDLLLLNLK